MQNKKDQKDQIEVLFNNMHGNIVKEYPKRILDHVVGDIVEGNALMKAYNNVTFFYYKEGGSDYFFPLGNKSAKYLKAQMLKREQHQKCEGCCCKTCHFGTKEVSISKKCEALGEKIFDQCELLVDIFLPIKAKSQNEHKGTVSKIYSKKKGRYVRKNFAYDKYAKDLRIILQSKLGRGKNKREHRICKIISIKDGRKFDDANFRGGMKPLPDILKDLGWIVDDHEKWFYCFYEQVAPFKTQNLSAKQGIRLQICIYKGN